MNARLKPLILLTLCLLVMGCDKNYVSSVERVAANDLERALIHNAESICPDLSTSTQSCNINDEGTDCQWWCDETPYSHVPFGVTGDAVDYYAGLIQNYIEQGPLHAGNPWSAEFIYMANITFIPDYRVDISSAPIPAYRATLSLQFNVVCGMNCLYGINAERVVVLAEDGSLLDMFGDQPYGYVVS